MREKGDDCGLQSIETSIRIIIALFSEANIPVWPSNFCTISLVCKFQIYMQWSSLPDTIHLPPVTLKLANMQYFSFLWPAYVLRHLPV